MVSNSNTKTQHILSRFKRKILSHVRMLRIVILSFIIFVILLIGFFTIKAISKSIIGTYVGMAKDFLVPSTSNIVSTDNRVNVLLLGKGGLGHDAPDLTDTMILASVSTTDKGIRLISIPRDIWVPSLNDKINSAYKIGKEKQANAGLALAKSVTEDIVGVPIQYAVLIDFGGFKNVVDAIGGINVNVNISFTDSQYPIEGKENDLCNGDITYACRYKTITFNAGPQMMNGETALEFVRSRHASGVEGNDIAREARQQLVFQAIQKKILTSQVLTNLSTDKKLFDLANNSIETDLKPNEEATLGRIGLNNRANLKSYGIPDELLVSPTNEYKYHNDLYTHAFVFVPAKAETDWSDVQNWVKSVLP